MQKRIVTVPELALVATTRAVLGAGVGLLLANRLNEDQRRATGWALVAVGALTTVPLALEILGHRAGKEAERNIGSGQYAGNRQFTTPTW